MPAPVQFEETEVILRPDRTIAIAFKTRETERDLAPPAAQVIVIGWPAGVALLRDQIDAVLAHLSPPSR